MSDKKPREFWLSPRKWAGNDRLKVYLEPYGNDAIHVIEKSAYDSLAAKLEEVTRHRDAFKTMVKQVKEIAQHDKMERSKQHAAEFNTLYHERDALRAQCEEMTRERDVLASRFKQASSELHKLKCEIMFDELNEVKSSLKHNHTEAEMISKDDKEKK